MSGRNWVFAAGAWLGLSGAALAQTETTGTETRVEMRDDDDDFGGDDGPSGLEVGVRGGYQGAWGHVVKQSRGLNGQVVDLEPNMASRGAVPFQLDLGARVSPHLFVGVYGSWGPVLIKENPYTCPTEDFDCSGWQLRFGPQVQYHFGPGAALDPWLGVGAGMIITRTNVSGPFTLPTPAGPVPGTIEPTVTDRGAELGNVALGLNLRAGGFAIGPFVHAGFVRNTVRSGEQVFTPSGGQAQTLPLSPVQNGFYTAVMGGVRIGITP